jgi:phosphodiesterase/alkaline phosphatase D-like protein
VVQGDVGFDIPETEDDSEARMADKDGYAAFLDALIAETKAFDGQVALVHGDTHYFKIDKPLPDATHMLSNFTRVQTFGSPNVHWIKVDVDATSRNVFTFSPMIVAANATKTLGE